MDLNEIKNLIEIDGGKFIIIENGKPAMVVVSFEEYKKKLTGRKNHLQTIVNPSPKELQSEELKLDDLPL
jgi:PHD/YefM family antitoxin component YafN of YafNO toxin-antitoxin module